MNDSVLESPRNVCGTTFDADVMALTLEQLREEVRALRNAIRLHRDERGHDRCWLDDGRLYGALPERQGAVSALPPWDEFERNCRKFWEGRQAPKCGR